MKKISVFGNDLIPQDSLPLQLLPELKKRFSKIKFTIEDPNELGIPSSRTWWIIDTVRGLEKVHLLSAPDINKKTGKKCSIHDYDLSFFIGWLAKINKKTDIRIIGVPPSYDPKKAFSEITGIIRKASLLQENGRRS